jgi:hypothetical protein
MPIWLWRVPVSLMAGIVQRPRRTEITASAASWVPRGYSSIPDQAAGHAIVAIARRWFRAVPSP